jgi:ABC-type sugar transport system ATPase subunit
MSPTGRPTILEARQVVKTFPGVRALDGVRLRLVQGEVHALVGENGAGKSTLIHVLGGVLPPDSGQIRLYGEAVRFRNAHDAALKGIGVVFQELSLSQNLSVAENIFANRQPVGRLNLIRRRRLNADAADLLEWFRCDVDPRTPVARLPIGTQQVVEILKAVSQRPRVLILDEPTSSLTGPDTQLLFRAIDQLKQVGTSFIYISHHLPEIFEIADRVTVFRDGKYVDTKKTADVTEVSLAKMMVGREIDNIFGQRTASVGEEYFRVHAASRGKAFGDVSFTLRRGEILGIAGLVGAGRTELGRGIFGVEPLEQGRIELEGRSLAIRSPHDAIGQGIGYLTEDRKLQGLFLRMTVRDNCAAAGLDRFAGRMDWMADRAVNRFAEDCRREFNIVTPSIRQKVGNLSGGNQQKVLLAMWMGIRPRVLIVDEPTRGVDVGARSEIYASLRRLAAEGVGIIMISSDLLEILGLSDRILVMRGGRLAGEFSAAEATEEKIIACAAGVAEKCI